MQTLATGLIVAIIGFFSSFPIVLAGLSAMGASPEQAASGLMAAALSMGLCGILISAVTRLPASVAWSTPGAAFLITAVAPEGGFASAVGAFLLAGGLTVIAGLWKPMARLVTAIPVPIAQAMLAGVLFSICAAPVRAIGIAPVTALVLIGVWALVRLRSRLWAVPVTVLAAAVLTLWHHGGSLPVAGPALTTPVLIRPELHVIDLLSIGIPLFLVTMATQNVPGLAVLRSHGYTPKAGPMLTTVGSASIVSAIFGAPATCLAALTAALCANEDSHPDPARRFMSAVWAGGFYCVMGLFAGLITDVAAAAPPQTMQVLAGIALFGVFVQSAHGALADPQIREAAALTFLITAAGVTLLGLGGAVWGLAAGSLLSCLRHYRRSA